MPRDYESRRDMAMRRRSMRDMARREREMRDGRDPRRRDRGMEDMTHGMDYNYGDMRGYDGNYDMRGYDRTYEDMARGRRDYGYPFDIRGEFDMARRRNSRGQYMSDGHYPMMPYMDYGYGDYASGEKLSEEDLMEWYEDLCRQIPEQYKHLYKKENIDQVAKQMNVQFDIFRPMDLVDATLVIITDYHDIVDYSDVHKAVAGGLAFLKDPDSNLKGSEKLAAYYDYVVNG